MRFTKHSPEAPMRIKQISVVNLFGTFNHIIPLNISERATIMIGPNGYGKTTILKMIDGIFNGKFSIFFRIPFQEFVVSLESGGYFKIEKKSHKKKREGFLFDLNLIVSEDGISSQKINLTNLDPTRTREWYYFMRNILDEDMIDKRTLAQLRHGSEFIDPDVYLPIIEKYWDIFEGESFERKRIPSEMLHPVLGEFSSKLVKIRTLTKELNVHFIQAQRLISRSKLKADRKTETETPVVSVYSEELTKVIAEKLAQSTERAQKLDSTFPHRVISQPLLAGTIETYKRLRDQLQVLREKRIHLKETGILVEIGGELEIPESIDDENRLNYLNGVLTEYVKDTQEKLAVFDELSDKIEVFKRIINDRFLPHKRLEINKDKGFTFITSTRNELAPGDLSSGEQHEIVLLYELLFKVPAGSLVLIDEPELSLHIAWQQQFLEDLLAIISIAKLDVLIATHAPDIIHNHWLLTVDLEKQEHPEG
jgi:predicted ATP-binding protein involved in virulence